MGNPESGQKINPLEQSESRDWANLTWETIRNASEQKDWDRLARLRDFFVKLNEQI